MTNYLNNCLIQLFDLIEAKCNINFVTFTDSDIAGNYTGDTTQEYMAAYKSGATGTVYKYLYDPGLSFNFRFHQYLADISYVYRENPWITLMFSTGAVKPVTNVLSHKYNGMQFITANGSVDDEGNLDDTNAIQDVIPYKTRRVCVPMQIGIVSNNISYLYENLEKISSYFDRFINFDYNQTIKYSSTKVMQWKVIGQCTNITQSDVQKLDTETRGTIVTTNINFNLIHWITDAPEAPLKLLEKVILEVRDTDVDGTLLMTEITE